jgi:hypothetical protein
MTLQILFKTLSKSIARRTLNKENGSNPHVHTVPKCQFNSIDENWKDQIITCSNKKKKKKTQPYDHELS